IRVEGVDPFAVHDAVATAAARCRKGEGPIFIETMTRRWAGSAPLWPELATGITDVGMATGRTPIGDGPHRAWFETHDPVLKLARELVAEGAEALARIEEIDGRTRRRIDEAAAEALASPFPAVET